MICHRGGTSGAATRRAHPIMGTNAMPAHFRPFALFAAAAMMMAPGLAQAAGDLLVAPTRLVLDGSRSTEVVLNNIGDAPATYRISLEIKRMTEAGGLDEVATDAANPTEQAALSMISFSPRRVVLPPNQPQVIRVGVRIPEGMAAGEYRAHMLFRAVPDVAPASAAAAPGTGVSIALTPIYGITIPVIVRVGDLAGDATIGDVAISRTGDETALTLAMRRTGTRSVYGDIEVTRPGVAEPLLLARGIAIYPEVTNRIVRLPIPPALAEQLKGAVHVRYTEDRELGGGTIDEADVVIR